MRNKGVGLLLSLLLVLLYSCVDEKGKLQTSIWKGFDSDKEYFEISIIIQNDSIESQINKESEGFLESRKVSINNYNQNQSIWKGESKLFLKIINSKNGVLITKTNDTFNIEKHKTYFDANELWYDFNDDQLFINRQLDCLGVLYPDSTFTIKISGGIFRTR